MSYRSPQLPLEVLCAEYLAHSTHVKSTILQLTTVAPVFLDTREVAERLEGKQVGSLAVEVVETQMETVVEQTCLHSYIPFLCRLPLQVVVTDISE